MLWLSDESELRLAENEPTPSRRLFCWYTDLQLQFKAQLRVSVWGHQPDDFKPAYAALISCIQIIVQKIKT